jgi:Immunity protein 53
VNGISLLEKWYSSQCDGEWEHGSGIDINTLDNPGWTLKINVRGTKAANKELGRIQINRTEEDWIHYWVENGQFNAACGPLNLSETIRLFVDWFENSN